VEEDGWDEGIMKDGILLAEDSKDDAYLIQRAFNRNGWDSELQVGAMARKRLSIFRESVPIPTVRSSSFQIYCFSI
jgi:hypothetical protein